jgi:hypothetical protein
MRVRDAGILGVLFLAPGLCLSQVTGCTGSKASDQLRLLVGGFNSSTGWVQIKGVDIRRPTVPFTWVWGDGATTRGWFPQSHRYSHPRGVYLLRVLSHENNGSVDCAQMALPLQTLADVQRRVEQSSKTRGDLNAATSNTKTVAGQFVPYPGLVRPHWQELIAKIILCVLACAIVFYFLAFLFTLLVLLLDILCNLALLPINITRRYHNSRCAWWHTNMSDRLLPSFSGVGNTSQSPTHSRWPQISASVACDLEKYNRRGGGGYF